mmetsp:Transcript_33491/g.82314  ORF Transcript_33491/g.82314 Transcript_33491/m.82314 type:complete len:489 (+) Transcript_33491:116-1582(+)
MGLMLGLLRRFLGVDEELQRERAAREAAEERERAAEERERAAEERAEEQQQRAEEELRRRKRQECSDLLVIGDLDTGTHKTIPDALPSHGRPPIFQSRQPKESAFTVSQNKDRNLPSSALLGTDIFGVPKGRKHHRAHLVPHSFSCRNDYISVLIFLAGEDSDVFLTEQQTRAMLYGWSPVGGSLVPHSRLVDQLFNHIAMKGQGDWLDNEPSVLLLSMLSWKQQLAWEPGSEYSCLVITTSGDVYCDVGANRCKEGFVVKLEQQRGRVEAALEAFGTALPLLISSVMQNGVPETAAEPRKSVRRLVRQHFAQQKGIAVPSLSGILQEGRASVCVVQFDPCSVPFPGERQQQQDATGHPAPCPLLLTLRSVNTWIRHLGSLGTFSHCDEAHLVVDHGASIFLACYDMEQCGPEDCEICWEKMKKDDAQRCSVFEAMRMLSNGVDGGIVTPEKGLKGEGGSEGTASGSSPDSTDSGAASAASTGGNSTL